MPDLEETRLLAAEVALGLVAGNDRDDIQRRLRSDAVYQRELANWQRRLSVMDDEYEPMTPPDRLAAINARLFPAPAQSRLDRMLGSPWFWRGALLAVLAAVVVKGLALLFLTQ